MSRPMKTILQSCFSPGFHALKTASLRLSPWGSFPRASMFWRSGVPLGGERSRGAAAHERLTGSRAAVLPARE